MEKHFEKMHTMWFANNFTNGTNLTFLCRTKGHINNECVFFLQMLTSHHITVIGTQCVRNMDVDDVDDARCEQDFTLLWMYSHQTSVSVLTLALTLENGLGINFKASLQASVCLNITFVNL